MKIRPKVEGEILNYYNAINFLKEHQPLPDDELLDEETVSKYEEVRRYFLNNPSPECIPLFLNSFGMGSGFGVYQLIEDVLLKFSKEQVLRHLIDALESRNIGVIYWSVQVASYYPNDDLVLPLSVLLNNQNADIRYHAVVALSEINSAIAQKMLRDRQHIETDQEIIELINNINESD